VKVLKLHSKSNAISDAGNAKKQIICKMGVPPNMPILI